MISLLINHLNPDIEIISYIDNSSLSKKIKQLYPFITTISLKDYVSPLLFSLVNSEQNVGYYYVGEKLYFVDEYLQTKEYIKNEKFENDGNSIIKKILNFQKIFVDATKSDDLFKYTLLSFMIFILFVTLFALYNGIIANLSDGLYFSTAILTTIGFGDINFSNSSIGVKILGSVIMLFGAVLMTILNASIINILITRKLKEAEYIFPIPKKDHIIVYKDLNEVNREILSNYLKFCSKIESVLISPQQLDADVVKQIGSSVVFGEESDELLFEKANIKSAKYLLATSKDDILNINSSLVGRILNKNMKIIYMLHSKSISKYLRYDDNSLIINSVAIISEVILYKILESGYNVIGFLIENGNILKPIIKIDLKDNSVFNNKTFYHVEHDFGFKVIEHEPLHKFELVSNYLNLFVAINAEKFHEINYYIVSKKEAMLKIDLYSEDRSELGIVEDYLDLIEVDYKLIDDEFVINISEGDMFSIRDYLKNNRVNFDIVYRMENKKQRLMAIYLDKDIEKSQLVNKLFKYNISSIYIDSLDNLEEQLVKNSIEKFVIGASTYKANEVLIKKAKDFTSLNGLTIEFVVVCVDKKIENNSVVDLIVDEENIDKLFMLNSETVTDVVDKHEYKKILNEFRKRELISLIEIEQALKQNKTDIAKIKILKFQDSLKKLNNERLNEMAKSLLHKFYSNDIDGVVLLTKKMIRELDDFLLNEGEEK